MGTGQPSAWGATSARSRTSWIRGPRALALLAVLPACQALPRDSAGGAPPLPGQASAPRGEAPAAAPAAAPTAGADPAAAWPLHGTLLTRYRFRSTGDDTDNDLYATLTLDAGNRRRDVVTGHLVARSEFDLDDNGNGTDPFFDVEDTYNADLTAHLIQGYADIHALDQLQVLRVGRQPLDETPEPLTFDGLRVESTERGPHAVRLGAYAGVPTHIYESSSAGDSLVGSFVEARPWEGGRARVDWMHIQDDLVLGDERNDLVGFSAWHARGRLRLDGGYTLLEGESRDLQAKASWIDAARELLLRLDYYRLLETQGSRVTALDPFTEALLEYDPFQRIGLSASKGLGAEARLELGTEVRRLVDGADEGPFNRDYQRHRVRLAFDEILGQPWQAGVGLERWDGDPSSITTWSADVSHEWNENWTVSASSTYALYDLDLITLDERQNVRLWALEARRELGHGLRLEILYEYEDDEIDHYHVLRGGLRWRF